jgi:hypothetical protein
VKTLFTLLSILFSTLLKAQNVGIGTHMPTLAKLMVVGTGGVGSATMVAFGTDGQGVSLQSNPLTIGFNQYRDNTTTNGRYMANGIGGTISFDPTIGTIDFKIFNSGLKDNLTDNGKSVFTILKNGSIGIGGSISETAGLWVTKKPTDIGGGVVFKGTNYDSKFYDLYTENTFINAGKDAGKVIINDIPGGKTIIANNTRIGTGGSINPQTTLELFGAISLMKEEVINICNETIYTFTPNNVSRAKITACSGSITELKLGDGIVFGQILILSAGVGLPSSSGSLTLKDTGNVDLHTDYNMFLSHPNLMLIWRKITPTTGRWTAMNQVDFNNPF